MEYDDFGNYIGPELSSDEDQPQQPRVASDDDDQEPQGMRPIGKEHRIVLHEDKKYYPTHDEVYPGAENLIEQQDGQTLETPIVSMEVQKNFDLVEELTPKCDREFFKSLMDNQPSIRNICVAGHLHHGKTLLMDLLIQEAYVKDWDLERNYRWMDTRADQQGRLISIKSRPVSLALPDSKGKHYLLNLIDTPGHSNFMGEVSCALRVCDGVLLVIDVIEGVMMMTEKILKLALKQRLPIVVMVSKMDRLILELKIPPEDAYLKVKHTLQQLNGLIHNICGGFNMNPEPFLVSPILGNVIFGSGQYGFVFSIQSFSEMYAKQFKSVDPTRLMKVFWGDFYFDTETRKFARKVGKESRKRAFVQFILQPLYKIFSHTVGKDRHDLQPFLATIGVFITTQEYRMNIKSLMKLVFKRYFSNSGCLVSALTQHLPYPVEGSRRIIQANYRGQRDETYQQLFKASADGPLLINIVKHYNKPDCKTFDVFGRVISGTVKSGQTVKIMGEEYTSEQQEDMQIKEIGKLFLLQGRYREEVGQVSAGNFVLIEGIDQAILKTATIVSPNSTADILVPIKFWTTPVMKVALEPLVPSQLPKMLQSLRKVTKSYPLIRTKVQESGQHIMFGNGQLELDCALHDIRNMFSQIELRLSDPSVTFAETVVDTSGMKCYADTANKKNRITTLSGPLDKGLVDAIEKQTITISSPQYLSNYLQKNFEWDILASNHVWAFGPDIQGPNILLNDSLPTGTDQRRLQGVKSSLVQGFRWSTREGPLCDQPMRNVKFRIIDADLSPTPQEISAGQLIPAARRAFYSSFLTATPRMMEPVLFVEIQCTSESINGIYPLIARRRGSVISESAKAGSPLHSIKCYIPVIDSFGFETDLRVHTVGQSFCQMSFDHWNMLPGDPLDKKIILRPLQPLQPHQLAREFMIKTRRRKGLNEEVSIVKYFDDLNIKELLMADASYREFI